MNRSADTTFAGSIPEIYDRYMVPLIFEPYAADLCRRVVELRPGKVLETAAGTGVVTRHLARELPREVAIVATDLNQPMLDYAASMGTARPVDWRQADAMQLPLPDGSVDVVVCQFGVMFFPDKPAAFAEAKRVLRPGGRFVFNAWDRIEENEMIAAVMEALAALFPQDPPRFMQRGPHGYADKALIAEDLRRAGFASREIVTIPKSSQAPSPREAALAYCQGTPLRTEIEAKGPDALAQATEAAAQALARRFGSGAIEGRIQAHVVVARA
jgi:ubiquinone/menaquinone biosynthesis C-methylase UbiE